MLSMQKYKASLPLEPGLNAEVGMTVSKAETAQQMGSGSIPVYATPAMVALMENAAIRSLEGHLPAGNTTVGGAIEVRHLAATTVGMQVRALAKLVDVQGKKLVFRIQVWDAIELVGEANHIRFIVNEDEFLRRAHGKGK
jgi:predicted thioesterase